MDAAGVLLLFKENPGVAKMDLFIFLENYRVATVGFFIMKRYVEKVYKPCYN